MNAQRTTLVRWRMPLLVTSLLTAAAVAVIQSHPDQVSGEASGVTARSGKNGKTKVGPSPQVVLPNRGGAASAEAPDFAVPDLISTGPLSVFTAGGYSTRDTASESVTTVENVSLLGGRVVADLVVAVVTSGGDGVTAESSAAGTEVVNLVVDGVAKGNISDANVGIPISGGTVIVNEQQLGGDGTGTSSLSVTGLRVILRDAWTWATTDDIRIGNVSSGVATSAFTAAHPLVECVFYTGGGRVDREPMMGNQDFATFGFNATLRHTTNCKGPRGQLQYVDHFRRIKFHGTSADISAEFEDFERGGKCARFSGDGRVNVDNAGWQPASYEAEACDNGEPGVGRDTFRISIPAISYSSLTEGKGPTLKGGNIQRHASDETVSDGTDGGTGDTPTPTPTRFEESAATLTGTWLSLTSSSFGASLSGDQAVFSETAGATATFTFTGTGVSWLGANCEQCGIARLSLDGTVVGEVDTFASTRSAGVLFTRTGLTAGSHTLAIEVTGTRNPSSTRNFIGVDAFDVTP